MRLRVALAAAALLAVTAGCGGSSSTPVPSAASSVPPASTAPASVAPATVAPSVAPTTTPAAGTTYTVKKGDTLWGLAQKFKPSSMTIPEMVKAIQAANPSLKNPNNLSIGQKLVIPKP